MPDDDLQLRFFVTYQEAQAYGISSDDWYKLANVSEKLRFSTIYTRFEDQIKALQKLVAELTAANRQLMELQVDLNQTLRDDEKEGQALIAERDLARRAIANMSKVLSKYDKLGVAVFMTGELEVNTGEQMELAVKLYP